MKATVCALLFVMAIAPAAFAQTPTPKPAQTPASPKPSARPFEIVDNSFIVEEAFNQEKGVFQNIFGLFRASNRDWDFGFTQEWPIGSVKHQLSFSLPIARVDRGEGLGDILINYRYQLWEENGRPAFTPRLSVVLPTGDAETGTGEGVVGWQVNLPFSKQCNDFYFHWNGGFTFLPKVLSSSNKVDLTSANLAASTIWRMKPMLHPMLESQVRFAEEVDGAGGARRTTYFTLSPSVRGGWNFGDHQVILGFGVPVTWGGGATAAGAFLYFSYELPFKRY